MRRKAAAFFLRHILREAFDHAAHALELPVRKRRIFVFIRQKQLRYRADHIRRAPQLRPRQGKSAFRFAARPPRGISRKPRETPAGQQREAKRAKPRFQKSRGRKRKRSRRSGPRREKAACDSPFSAALKYRCKKHRQRKRPCARDLHAPQHAGRAKQHRGSNALRPTRPHGTQRRKRRKCRAKGDAHLRAERACGGNRKAQAGQRKRKKRRKKQERCLIRPAQTPACRKRGKSRRPARHNDRRKAGKRQFRYADEAIFGAAAMEKREQHKICSAKQRKLFRRAQPPAPEPDKKPAANIERGGRKRGNVSGEERTCRCAQKRREGWRAHQPGSRHGSRPERRKPGLPGSRKQERKRGLKRARNAKCPQARQHRRAQPLQRLRHDPSLPNALCKAHDTCLSTKRMPNKCNKNARILQCSAGYIRIYPDIS